jgi:hypothetical protein
VVKALEGLEGAENCAGYSFVEQRGTWAAETKRLEKELAAHSKHKQRVGVLHVSSRRMSFIFRQMHAGLHGRSTGLVSVFPLEDPCAWTRSACYCDFLGAGLSYCIYTILKLPPLYSDLGSRSPGVTVALKEFSRQRQCLAQACKM